MKPCKSCPFQPTAKLGLWDPAHYLLIAYLGSVREFVEPSDLSTSMGCHQFNGVVRPNPSGATPRCGGWVRAAFDSFAMRMARSRMTPAELAELDDDAAVLSPEDMARLNGLDMRRVPPLSWNPGDRRYPTQESWRHAVSKLRASLTRNPRLARTYVVPGSPLDIGVSDEDIREALGDEAAERYAARAP